MNYTGIRTQYKQIHEGKHVRLRSSNVEEELFMLLTRLRCAFPIEDMAARFKMDGFFFQYRLQNSFHKGVGYLPLSRFNTAPKLDAFNRILHSSNYKVQQFNLPSRIYI